MNHVITQQLRLVEALSRAHHLQYVLFDPVIIAVDTVPPDIRLLRDELASLQRKRNEILEGVCTYFVCSCKPVLTIRSKGMFRCHSLADTGVESVCGPNFVLNLQSKQRP